jgi:hypothetical protein
MMTVERTAPVSTIVRVVAIAVLVVVGVGVAVGFVSNQHQSATGIVIDVDARSLTNVPSFTLRQIDGQVLAFEVGHLDGGFPAGHLLEHRATSAPVRVTYDVKNGRNVAIRLEDGP